MTRDGQQVRGDGTVGGRYAQMPPIERSSGLNAPLMGPDQDRAEAIESWLEYAQKKQQEAQDTQVRGPSTRPPA